MGEWVEATVLDLQSRGILRVEDGNHGEARPRPDEFTSDGVAFIRAADLSEGRVLFESASGISDVALRRITKGIGLPGDVLLSHKGTVGKVARVPMDAPDFVCSPQTTFWRTTDPDSLDRLYLHAFLRSPGFHAQLASRSGETDMAPYVSLTAQRTLRVTLPPIAVQRCIGGIIGAIDDTIEVNRRMAATLEEMARALFRSWFVDFDPVRAKAQGRDPGVPSEIADLFPDRLVDSSLGLIPEDWSVQPLDDLAHFRNGLALQKYPPESGQARMKVIKIAQLRSGNTDNADECGSSVPQDYVVDDGDVLFSWSGSLECAYWAGGRGALNQHLFKVTASRAPLSIGYLAVHHFLPSFRETAAGKATTMGHIQRHHLTDARLAMPDFSSVDALSRHLDPLVERGWRLRVEARSLSELRDALLQQLLSGEICTSDPEDFLARMEAVG